MRSDAGVDSTCRGGFSVKIGYHSVALKSQIHLPPGTQTIEWLFSNTSKWRK
jgi:hypothetical protein